MKFRHIFLLLFVIALSGCKNDDNPINNNTFSGDIVLQTQSQIEDLGASEVTKITGSVRIGGSAQALRDIVSLSPLNKIDSITGDLSIIGTSTLVNLGGLQRLKYVGGRVIINYNEDLNSLLGLENLQSTGKSFSIGENDALESIGVNMALSDVGEVFSVDNNGISDLNAFSNLTRVGDLNLSRLANLTDLDGLSALESIGFRLWISENPSLDNIRGLSNLSTVGDITLWNNNRLSSLEGLEGITGSTGLYLRGLPSLRDLTGLNNITSLRFNLIIADNENLESLNGLQTDIEFVQEKSILSMVNLPKLQTMDNYTFSGRLSELIFADLPLIESLPTFAEQDSVDYLAIAQNERLRNIDELVDLTFAVRLLLLQNSLIEHINGLSGLKSTFRMEILDNPRLNNLDGFSNLNEVIQDTRIENNQSLINLCGLTTAANADGLKGDYSVSANGFNPSIQDIKDGNCEN